MRAVSDFFNLMAVETLFTVWVVLFLWWTWPSPPWDVFQIWTVVLMLISPFAPRSFCRASIDSK